MPLPLPLPPLLLCVCVCVCLCLYLTHLPRLASSEPDADKAALLAFLAGVGRGATARARINWPTTPLACAGPGPGWTGVTCSPDGARVVALHLPGLGLSGAVQPGTLGRLTALQLLSLRSNNLSGPLPADLLRLPALAGLHLHRNAFSGALPPGLAGLAALQALDLSSNGFGGGIPGALTSLTRLVALDLSNNSLSGRVPDLGLPALQFLNLSNNRLDGPVPPSLLRFADAAFAGNDLTRPPAAAPPAAAAPAARTRRVRLSEAAILAVAVGGCVLAFAVAAVLLLAFCNREGRDDDDDDTGGAGGKGGEKKGRESPESKAVIGKAGEGNRMVFFEGPALAFDLEDLLRASAEVLGKGAFGTAYRAVLEDATTVVVKRLSKEVSAGRRDFEQQMELVGRIRHRNVVELRAYYYSKDEKLLVYDYYASGSVSNMLHGMYDPLTISSSVSSSSCHFDRFQCSNWNYGLHNYKRRPVCALQF
jgi:hypothetical protein